LPGAVSGQNGHKTTIIAANILVHGFALEIDAARPLLQAWNQECQPPWSDQELEHKLEEARDHPPPDKPRGHLRDQGLPAQQPARPPILLPGPPIEVGAVIARVEAYVESKDISKLFLDEPLLADLARLGATNPAALTSAKLKLASIRGFSSRDFRASLRPFQDALRAPVAQEKGPAADDDGEPPIGVPEGWEDNPHRLATCFLSDYDHADGGRLRFWQGQYHLWDGGHYAPLPIEELRAQIAAFLEREFLNIYEQQIISYRAQGGDDGPPRPYPVTTRLINDVIQAIAGKALLPVAQCRSQPAWIYGQHDWSVRDVIPMRNALVHLPSAAAGAPCAVPPTPAFFASYALDFDFKPDAPEPAAWLEFLRQLWPDDPDSVATLQQWMGYLLTTDTSQQKIMMLIGPTRAGKGTIARVIRALLGEANVVDPTLSSLTTNFGLAPLLGKPLAIIADARISGRSDTAVVVERLLSLSGEDSVTVDRKFLEAVTVKLSTRFMVLSNELPKLRDCSGALVDRMIFLRLVHSFLGREDPALFERLRAELPGIVKWAAQGWIDLRKLGRFVQPASGRDLAAAMGLTASPIKAYLVDNNYVVDPKGETPIDLMFMQWQDWCKGEGQVSAGSSGEFGRALRAAVPGIERVRARAGAARKWCYRGIRVMTEREVQEREAALEAAGRARQDGV
jgi:putative DNA primase/helicase